MHACKQSHLRCFVAAAELGSISAAAKRLHRTPSAISMTITQLESQLGRPLFEAGNKSRLTPFGDFVYSTAREQLKQFERSLQSIRAYARNDIGRVDIAAVPSFATRHLPDLLATFIGRYPQVTLSIVDDSSERINQQVEQGLIDVGIASPAEASARLNFQAILTDPLGVVCARSHPLTRLGRPLDWADLETHRFISNGTCGQIRDTDFQAVVAAADMDVQTTTSLLALVAAGFGVTTLPRLAVLAGREDVAFVPTRYPGLQRILGIVTSAERSLSPAAEAFVAAIDEAF